MEEKRGMEGGRTEGTVDLNALGAVSLSISWNRHVYLNGYLKECNDIRECVCVCLGEETEKARKQESKKERKE